jgi:rhodanese-related sulfurtransferase
LLRTFGCGGGGAAGADGPHCNGANRAAVRLAELGRPVKEMTGGITGWQDEGFELAHI